MQDFRYFLLCRSASKSEETGECIIRGVIDRLDIAANEPIELVAIVSAAFPGPTEALSLELEFLVDNPSTLRQAPFGMSRVQLDLPSSRGIGSLPYPIRFFASRSGTYRSRLICVDEKATFRVLASFVFYVDVR